MAVKSKAKAPKIVLPVPPKTTKALPATGLPPDMRVPTVAPVVAPIVSPWGVTYPAQVTAPALPPDMRPTVAPTVAPVVTPTVAPRGGFAPSGAGYSMTQPVTPPPTTTQMGGLPPDMRPGAAPTQPSPTVSPRGTPFPSPTSPYLHGGFYGGSADNLRGAEGMMYATMMDWGVSQGYLPGQITYPELNVNISQTSADALAAAGYQEVAPYGYFLPGSDIGNQMGVTAPPGTGGGGGGGGGRGGGGGGGGFYGGYEPSRLIMWRIGY